MQLLAVFLIAQAAGVATWTSAQKEEFLRTARIVELKTLTQGITNSRRATLTKDGITHDAHVQTIDEQKTHFQGVRGNELNFRDSFKFNIAAYKLDRVLDLNMVPVSVFRKVDGAEAAVTWWVDDVLMTELERYKRHISAPNPDTWNQQMYVVRVFDQLIGNTDRNLGNLVVCKNWDVWMIDHTRAFRMRKDLPGKENLGLCDRELLARLKTLNRVDLHSALKEWVKPLEIDGLLARRDLIVAYYEGQVRARGESAVLYDYIKVRGEKQPR